MSVGDDYDFSITIPHDTVHEISFNASSHSLQPGDIVRFMRLLNGDCSGAADADPEVHGGHLDDNLQTEVRLPGGVDGMTTVGTCYASHRAISLTLRSPTRTSFGRSTC